MARVTRSKKIDIAEDHTAFTIATKQLPGVVTQTNPLAEIATTNPMASIQDPIAAELKGLKAAYRTAIGGTRKGGKKSKKQKKNKLDASVEGSEGQDDNENVDATSVSPVPEATRQLLQSREDEEQKDEELVVKAPVSTGRTTRRQAAKEQAAGEALTKSTTADLKSVNTEMITAIDVVEVSNSPRDATVIEEGAVHISPVRAPVRTLEEVERTLAEDKTVALTCDAGEDSFVEQITARSPAKHVSRIEDSVEALDQLEEAIEALDQATSAERIISPEKTRQKALAQVSVPTTTLDSKAILHKAKAERETGSKASHQNATKQQSSKPGYASMRVKPTAPKASIIKKATSMIFKPTSSHDTPPTEEKTQIQSKPKAQVTKRPMSMIVKSRENEENTQAEPTKRVPIKRPISLLPPKEPVKSTKPVTKATFELPGEAIARRLKEQREARLAQRESSEDSFHTARAVSGPKIKSTKPPTTSTFELPGEAVSRKKREAHEARLKAQEEEERKRREFKAKPLRKSVVPNVVPRDTVASRARQSKIGLENIVESGTVTSTGSIKRGSGSNVGAHRPSLSQLTTANTSVPRSPGPSPIQLTRKPSVTTASGISMSGRAMQRTVSATEVQVQRQRAKEIYNRDARLAEDIERERREREAAAKRAREEAAERGRQASREWAEKQMAKRMAEGDKGMSAGYGPGGQLGLKG